MTFVYTKFLKYLLDTLDDYRESFYKNTFNKYSEYFKNTFKIMYLEYHQNTSI